jgi:ribosomal protein S6--L-glutamate ligase
MKIAILSLNKDIYSTDQLVKAVVSRGHEAVVVNYKHCSLVVEQGNPSIYVKGEKLSDIDAIVPRIAATYTDFGAAVIRHFEAMNVPSSLSSIALVRSRDKLRSFQHLAKSGIGVPKTAFAKSPMDEDVDLLIKSVGGAPVILKLLESSLGKGVIKSDSVSAAKSTIEAFSGIKKSIIIQEYIEEAGGADIRVFVVDGQIVGAMKRQGKEGDFRSNLHRGGSAEITELSKKEQAVALESAKLLGLNVAGVDLLRAKRGPLVIEVNSSPGLQGIERVTGADVAGVIIDSLVSKVEKRKAKKARMKEKAKLKKITKALHKNNKE